MAKHSHEWVTQMYVFPEKGDDAYEYDSPYIVEYCTDRECGERQTREISDEEVQEVRAAHGLPAEEIVSADDSEEGGDE